VSAPATSVRRLGQGVESTSLANDLAPAMRNMLNGAVMARAEFTASPQAITVVHRLGRAPRGWLVSRVTGGPWGAYELSSDAQVIVLRNIGAPAYAADLVVF